MVLLTETVSCHCLVTLINIHNFVRHNDSFPGPPDFSSKDDKNGRTERRMTKKGSGKRRKVIRRYSLVGNYLLIRHCSSLAKHSVTHLLLFCDDGDASSEWAALNLFPRRLSAQSPLQTVYRLIVKPTKHANQSARLSSTTALQLLYFSYSFFSSANPLKVRQSGKVLL